jgi:hypothetical protein
MADAADSKSAGRKPVWVRLPPPAPEFLPGQIFILAIRAWSAPKTCHSEPRHGRGEGSLLFLAFNQREIPRLPRREASVRALGMTIFHASGPSLEAACPAKTVIGIFEFRGNAGAGRSPRHFDVVTPRASARRAPCACGGSLRIPLWRNRVIPRVIPIRAPFMDIVAQIKEAVRIGRIQSNGLRTRFPSVRVIRNLFGRAVAPGIQFAFYASACSAFPFGFGREPVALPEFAAQPIAVCDGVKPRHSDDRLFGMREIRIVPKQRRRMASLFHKSDIFRVRRLVCRQLKRINPDSMLSLFIIPARVAAHPEPAFWNTLHYRL